MDREIRLYNRSALAISEKLEKEVRTTLRGKGYPEDFKKIFFSPLPEEKLGVFSPEDRLILLSEKLLQSADYEVLLNVALHEAAHFVEYSLYSVTGHDTIFRSICKNLGATEGFEKARITIEKQTRVLDKIKKLEALSSSPFESEAQSAMQKVRQLMAAHSIKPTEEVDNQKIYEMDLVSASRISQKHKCLANMIKLLSGVYIVSFHSEAFSGIRAYGDKEELEVASYLYDCLERSIDKELKRRRKDNPNVFRGAIGTSSFYHGVYTALHTRFTEEKESEDTHALMHIHNENEERAKALVFYKMRLQSHKNYYRQNSNVYKEGRSFGEKLNINKGIKHNTEKKYLN